MAMGDALRFPVPESAEVYGAKGGRGKADRPLFAFAGLWTSWAGVRGPKSAPVEGEHELFGLLTTEPSAIVARIHPKAMPVILTTPAEVDRWLGAETPDALELQRPLPDEALRIVASGKKTDSYDIIDTL